MAVATLKSLHAHLRLVENPSELKRKLPTSPNLKNVKEGLNDLSKLVGIDSAVFKGPQNIAALVGAQRFAMIWGEPSVTDHIARVFDSSRVLLTVLIDPTHFENVTAGPMGPTSGTLHPQASARAALSNTWAQPKNEPPVTQTPSRPEPESPAEGLKPLLVGNLSLTSRLFRALFEHTLGFVSASSAQQGTVVLLSESTGSREHSRSFLSTALFILGAEVDRDNLMSFMMQQGLFGLPIFEHMLQNRDYCHAFYTYRRLERAFVGPPTTEEAKLRNRLDQLNMQFGGKPCGGQIFGTGEPDKDKIDACLAATDLLEALALTPWCICLSKAISASSSHSIQSVAAIAKHFERFAHAQATKDQANKDIAEHLLAFARQFSTDSEPGEEAG